MWHEGIEVTLIPGHSDEHATGNPGLRLHGGRVVFVQRHNHRRKQTIREIAQKGAAGLSQRRILESEDPGPLCGRQHTRHAGAMPRGGSLGPPAQHPSPHVQAHRDDGALQHTGSGIGFQPPQADPASPNRPQP